MPTTRAARRAARCLTEVLPADALGLVLYQLPLAHDIAAVSPTCHQLCDAAKIAMKLRPFTGKVVTFGPHAGQPGFVNGVAAAGGQIITYTGTTVNVWHVNVRQYWTVSTIAHPAWITDLAVLPDGSRIITLTNDGSNAAPEGIVKLWTFDGTLMEMDTLTLENHVCSVAVMPDGVHFVIGLGVKNGFAGIQLYNVDGTLVHSFPRLHTAGATELAVTRDGQHIISGSQDHLVKVWSVATKSLVSTCEGHTNHIHAVAATPDGQRILSSGLDDTVRVWLLNGTHKKTFHHHHHDVKALVAMPDNQHALSGSWDATVKLFVINTGDVLRTFRHHKGPYGVIALALLPDGRRFISGAGDKNACIVEHGLAPFV